MNKKTIKLTQKLIKLAMNVSNNNFSVFIDWSPHVRWISVSVYQDGWKRNTDPTWDEYVDLKDPDIEEQFEKLIMRIKSEVAQ